MMKRLFTVIFILTTFLIFNSCDTSLNKYSPKNEDEINIVEFLNSYTDARNKGDVNTLHSMFHNNSEFTEADGTKLTKNQILETGSEWWTGYGKMTLLNPKILITGDEATVSLTIKFGWLAKTTQKITLIKEDDNWLFLKVVTKEAHLSRK